MLDLDDVEVEGPVIPKKGENYFCPKTGAHFHFQKICKKIEKVIKTDPFAADRSAPRSREIKQNGIKISKIPNTEKRRKIIQNKQNEKYNLDTQDYEEMTNIKSLLDNHKEIKHTQAPHQTQITEQDDLDDKDQERQNQLFKALKHQAGKHNQFSQNNSRQQTFTNNKAKSANQKLNTYDLPKAAIQQTQNYGIQKQIKQQGKLLFPPNKIMFNKQPGKDKKIRNDSHNENSYAFKTTKRITTEPDVDMRLESVQSINNNNGVANMSNASLYGSPQKRKRTQQKSITSYNVENLDSGYLRATQQYSVPLSQNKNIKSSNQIQKFVNAPNVQLKSKKQSAHNINNQINNNRMNLHRRNKTSVEPYGINIANSQQMKQSFKTPNIINGSRIQNMSSQQVTNKSPNTQYRQNQVNQISNNNNRVIRSLRVSQ